MNGLADVYGFNICIQVRVCGWASHPCLGAVVDSRFPETDTGEVQPLNTDVT